jgi:hypothetical protein
MLNLYKVFDNPTELPLYNELKSALPRLLHPSQWRDENYTREDFKPVEPIIIKNPETSYYYASGVLHSRFPEGEPIIMKSPVIAVDYARFIIAGRWEDAEPYIMKEPEPAYLYARDVLADDPDWTKIKGHENGRWPEAEPVIMKSPYYAYWYSIDVIGGRWTEAEPYIQAGTEDGNYWWGEYKDYFGIEE